MIRWITQNLGTAPANTIENMQEDIYSIVDVRNLVDKQGNTNLPIKNVIEKGVALLSQGKRVVVCCDYGISRSNSIAAGILAQFLKIPFSEAVRKVIEETHEVNIKLEMLESVRVALDGETKLLSSEKRILFTGGSGFIGSKAIPILAKEHFIIAPSHTELDLSKGAMQLDLYVKENAINQIMHFANPRVYTSLSALGETLHQLRCVLEVCKNNHIHLLYPSGWEVFSGYHSNHLTVYEHTKPYAKGVYGETKTLAEHLIQHHREQYGLQCTLLRSSPIYGEGSDRPKFIYTFIEKALRNDSIITHKYKNGLPALDLLHIDDVVSALCSTAKQQHDGILHIAKEQLISTFDIAKKVVHLLSSKSSVSLYEVNDCIANIVLDTSKTKALLQWTPKNNFEDWLAKKLEITTTKREG